MNVIQINAKKFYGFIKDSPGITKDFILNFVLPEEAMEEYKRIARINQARKNFEQAIRKNNPSKIQNNIELIDVNEPLLNGELPIHFAVRQGNKKAVEILLDTEADPLKKDFQGLTAVDHAFLQKKHSLLPFLIEDSEIENQKKIAQQQDPLRVPWSHYLFFSTNIVIFSIMKTLTIKNQNQKKIKQLSKDLDWFKMFSSVFVQFENWDNPSKMSSVVLGNAFFSNQEVLSTLFSTWKTYDLGKIMFRGLKASYNNIRYRPFKATWNALIYTANLGFLLQNTREIFQDTREIFGKFQESYAEFNTKLHQHLHCIDGICPEHYFEINKAVQDLSILERLEYKDLNPSVPFCALKIIDPTFTMQQLQQQGKKLYTKPYYKLQQKMHPDKTAQNSNKKAQFNESNAASAQLNTAKETLDQWVEKNTVKQEL